MGAPNDDEPPRSHPYRTPTEVTAAPPSSVRAPKARVLSALAVLSAVNGADDVSETLSRRAEDARHRETVDAIEAARDLRRKARAAFEEELWEMAESLYRHVIELLHDGARGPVLDDVIALATTLRQMRRWEESEALFRRATASREELRDEAPIVAVHDLGVLLVHLGRFDDARRILERALERAEHVQLQTPSMTAEREVARLHHALAECALDDDDPLVARRHVDRALGLRVALEGSDDPIFGATLATAARVLQAGGDLSGAASSLRRAIALMKANDRHTIGSAQALVMLAGVIAETSRLDIATRLVDEAIRELRERVPEHAFLCRALRTRARIDRLAGRHDEGIENESRVARIVALWCGPT